MTEPSSRHLYAQHSRVSAQQRREVLGHGPATVWFTGLSGSGKSTLAYAIERELIHRGVTCYVLDGDNVRRGLNDDLGFTPSDRTENIRRIGEVCRLMVDAGLVVLSAFISPYREDRDRVRARHDAGTFYEVHVSTPLEICESRDAKGLYAKARAGLIEEFSGVSAPYEPPIQAELILDTSASTIDMSVQQVIRRLSADGVLSAMTDQVAGP